MFTYNLFYDGKWRGGYKEQSAALERLWPRNMEMRAKAEQELRSKGHTFNGPMEVSRDNG